MFGGGSNHLVREESTGGASLWGEAYFGLMGDFPHPPSRENPELLNKIFNQLLIFLLSLTENNL